MTRLILASASPRRAELLRAAGMAFDVQPAEIDERVREGEAPETYVRRLSEDKARAVRAQFPDRVVLAADTVVVVDGQILGKPRDADDAWRMLRLLSGRTHDVMTGVALIGPPEGGSHERRDPPDDGRRERREGGPRGGREHGSNDSMDAVPSPDNAVQQVAVRVAATLVEFAPLADTEIRSYVASGEPMDKAGAYAIQGLASRFVTRIDGSYSNVVGLPIALVYDMCTRAGILVS